MKTDRKHEALRHVAATTGYRADFGGFLLAHWNIYEEFERLAVQAEKRGRTRLSAKFLCELIRWNTAMSEAGPYKVNNNHPSCMARLCVHLNPHLDGLFEFRARAIA